jgi:hypothetical protein
MHEVGWSMGRLCPRQRLWRLERGGAGMADIVAFGPQRYRGCLDRLGVCNGHCRNRLHGVGSVFLLLEHLQRRWFVSTQLSSAAVVCECCRGPLPLRSASVRLRQPKRFFLGVESLLETKVALLHGQERLMPVLICLFADISCHFEKTVRFSLTSLVLLTRKRKIERLSLSKLGKFCRETIIQINSKSSAQGTFLKSKAQGTFLCCASLDRPSPLIPFSF